MAEGHHEKRDRSVLENALLVAPGLAHGMGAVVARESRRLAPAFQHCIEGRNAQRATGPLRDEERCVRSRIGVDGEPMGKRGYDGIVERDGAVLAGFGLLDLQQITSAQMRNLADRQGEHLVCSVCRVDPECEQTQIPRAVGQQGFDAVNGRQVADRLDLDGGALGRVIVVPRRRAAPPLMPSHGMLKECAARKSHWQERRQ